MFAVLFFIFLWFVFFLSIKDQRFSLETVVNPDFGKGLKEPFPGTLNLITLPPEKRAFLNAGFHTIHTRSHKSNIYKPGTAYIMSSLIVLNSLSAFPRRHQL